MNQRYLGFLEVLAHKKRILVFDDNSVVLRTQPELLEAFELFNVFAVSKNNREHLSSLLTAWKPDVILVESSEAQEVVELCEEVAATDWKIAIVVVVPDDADVASYRAANAYADTMLCRPCTHTHLLQKLVTAMAAKQSMIQLSHSLNLETLLKDKGDIESFKITFEGNILVLCESLEDLSNRLKTGELGEDLFEELAAFMDAISKIFAHHHYTSHVAKIFDNLALYLRQFNFDSIDIEDIEGFDYLVNIIDDIIFYVKNFFVNRVYSDVYVFEHSLENSIEFMKNRLSHNEDILSDLEFFR